MLTVYQLTFHFNVRFRFRFYWQVGPVHYIQTWEFLFNSLLDTSNKKIPWTLSKFHNFPGYLQLSQPQLHGFSPSLATPIARLRVLVLSFWNIMSLRSKILFSWHEAITKNYRKTQGKRVVMPVATYWFLGVQLACPNFFFEHGISSQYHLSEERGEISESTTITQQIPWLFRYLLFPDDFRYGSGFLGVIPVQFCSISRLIFHQMTQCGKFSMYKSFCLLLF